MSEAQILKHSESPDGFEVTTFEVTLPRIVLAELNTHRMFSRNSASTRAIPLANQLKNLLENPFVPEKFGVNQPGMQAYSHLKGMRHDQAVEVWLNGRDRAVTSALELTLGKDVAQDTLGYNADREYVHGDVLLEHLDELKQLIPKSTETPEFGSTKLNVHKQLAGRGLEAYMWQTVVLTGTEFDNFYALRDHPEAQGEIATAARLMREAQEASTPQQLNYGEWHLPYVDDGEFDDPYDGIRASAARCAAVSYNRQRNKNPDSEFKRYDQLVQHGHMSPLEHQATPFSKREFELRRMLMARIGVEVARAYHNNPSDTATQEHNSLQLLTTQMEFSGNLRGFTQHRKQVPHEANFGDLRTD